MCFLICSNVHDDVTYFEIWEFMENTKLQIWTKYHSFDETIPIWYQRATIKSDQSMAIL